MKDNWWNHNTDKILLYSLVLLTGYIVVHIVHHGDVDQSALAWAENAFSTVLGALILILTGRIQRTNGGTSGTTKPTNDSAPVTPGAVFPTYPKQ